MTRIQHAGGAVSATLSSSITSGDATIACDNLAGWPDGSVGPFYAVINRGKPTEEKIRAAGRSTNTLTGVIRGQDGTTASAHSSAETIDHIFTATEADAANAHIEATTGVHGTTGALVGATQTQTLTNKTLTTPVINGATLSGTITNGGTISGGTVSGATISGGSISGTVTNGGTISGGTVNATTLQQGGVQAVTTTGTQTLTNKTLTAPAIVSPTITSGTGSLILHTTGAITIPGTITSDTLVAAALTQTLTNKTLTSPSLTGTVGGSATYLSPTINSGVLDSTSAIGGVTGGQIAVLHGAMTSGTFASTNTTGAAGTVYYLEFGKLVFLRYHFSAGTVTATGPVTLTIPNAFAAAAAGRQTISGHGLTDSWYVNASGTTLTSYGSPTAGANLTGYTAEGWIEVA